MRAAMYLRISLDRYGDGLAIARQREDCEGIIQARGWTLVETYVDQSISASDAKKNRPAYTRMVEDWHRGRFDAIVCWDLDRLTRQPRQLEDWIDAAESDGLRLVTANGEADLGTDAGRMFARIKAAVARQEVDRKSARQQRAAQQRAEQGKPWGARRAFGYTADHMELVPEEAQAVRQMYADYLAGMTQAGIAKKLNDAGLLSTAGKPWSQPRVREFLRSARNAGLREYRGKVVGPAAWPAIVSEDTWRATLHRMDTTAPDRPKTVRKYLLSGLARCGVCDTPVRTGYTRGGVRQYVCPHRHIGRAAEPVEEYATALVLARLERHGLTTPPADDGEDLHAEAQAIRDRMDALAVEFADGSLTASQLRTATEKLRANLDAVTARMAEQWSDPELGRMAAAPKPATVWAELDMHRRRTVLSALLGLHIDRAGRGVGFHPDQVRVTWKEHDGE